MRSTARRFGPALACLVLLASGSAAAARPAITLADCRLTHPAGLAPVAARCGHLDVPEDPADPRGHRIRLAVAVAPAADGAGQAPPLFVVAGGPGQAASDFYALFAAAFAGAGRTRDIVLVDQRGTGASNPLRCEFPDDFTVTAPPPRVIRALSAKCRRELAGRPEFYTTSVAVRDLEAVRTALGYERIALYGVSYGTRVVEHYLRRFGAHAAAVILDGVLPPDRTLGPDTPLDAQRALDLMFERCRADAGCNAAFPELAARFDALLESLHGHPARVTVADPATGKPETVEFDRAQLAGAVRLLNYYTQTTALLPLYIDRATHGDYAPFAGALLTLSQHLDEQLAYGMNVAITCSEDAPGFAGVDRGRMAATYLGAEQVDDLRVLCEGWPRGVVDKDLFAPLDSAVPALLLSGEADPVTPPAAAARAAAGLHEGLHLVVRGQGHGQLAVPCVPQLVADFLDRLSVRGLDTHCLAAAGPDPFLLSPTGPGP